MKTCLIVDDSGIIRKVARRILESLKFQILEAENGEQAFDPCQREFARCDIAGLEYAENGRL